MRYYIIAGEASGDLHGSNLVRELKKLDQDAEIRCWGGELMMAAGATVVKDYRELAFMGFLEVILNIRTIFRNLRFCKKDIATFRPDVLILVDYPGFNLRIAEWSRQQGIKTVYYISPQVWAWKESRVKQIKQTVDKMLVILPFEEEFYRKWDFPVEYVGHPLVEVVDKELGNMTTINDGSPLNEPNIIAILPGSRIQEITKKLPVMLAVTRLFPNNTFIVAMASSLPDEFYERHLRIYPKVRSVRDKTYTLLKQSKAAIVTSGTATLETALFAVPQVVCYKGSAISYQIAKRLVKVRFISLVNLIMNREVVKELIQDELTVSNLKNELDKIIHDKLKRKQILEEYNLLKQLLRKGGNASANAARSVYELIKPFTAGKKIPV